MPLYFSTKIWDSAYRIIWWASDYFVQRKKDLYPLPLSTFGRYIHDLYLSFDQAERCVILKARLHNFPLYRKNKPTGDSLVTVFLYPAQVKIVFDSSRADHHRVSCFNNTTWQAPFVAAATSEAKTYTTLDYNRLVTFILYNQG